MVFLAAGRDQNFDNLGSFSAEVSSPPTVFLSIVGSTLKGKNGAAISINSFSWAVVFITFKVVEGCWVL